MTTYDLFVMLFTNSQTSLTLAVAAIAYILGAILAYKET